MSQDRANCTRSLIKALVCVFFSIPGKRSFSIRLFQILALVGERHNGVLPLFAYKTVMIEIYRWENYLKTAQMCNLKETKIWICLVVFRLYYWKIINTVSIIFFIFIETIVCIVQYSSIREIENDQHKPSILDRCFHTVDYFCLVLLVPSYKSRRLVSIISCIIA